MHSPKRLVGLAVLMLSGLTMVACPTPTPTPTEPGPPPPSDSKAAVTLTEWAVKYALQEPGGAFGTVEFTVRNDGDAVHAFAIYRGGSLAGDSIEVGELLARTKNIQAGEMATLSETLEPGDYWLVCPITSHTELGMNAQLTVGTTGGG